MSDQKIYFCPATSDSRRPLAEIFLFFFPTAVRIILKNFKFSFLDQLFTNKSGGLQRPLKGFTIDI